MPLKESEVHRLKSVLSLTNEDGLQAFWKQGKRKAEELKPQGKRTTVLARGVLIME